MELSQLYSSSGPSQLSRPEERRLRGESAEIARVTSRTVKTTNACNNAEIAARPIAMATEADQDCQKRPTATSASDARSRAFGSQQINEDRQKCLDAMRAFKVRSRAAETDEHRQKRLAVSRASGARSRTAETDEHRQKRLAVSRASDARSRAAETDEHRQKRLAAKRASYARSLSAESAEKRLKRLDGGRDSNAKSLTAETSVKRQKRLDDKNFAQATLRATKTAKELRQRLDVIKVNRVGLQRSCGPAVAMNALQTDAAAEEAPDNDSVLLMNRRRLEHMRRTELSLRSLSKLGVADVELFDEKVYPPALIHHALPSLHAAGTVCIHCKAMRWREERSGFCCGNGKIVLPPIPSLPDAISTLYIDVEFLQNIRRYNNALSLASLGMGLEIIRPGFSPVVTLQGKLYHLIGTLLPINNSAPKFAQIYFVDSNNEIKNRMRHNPNLRPDTLTSLQTCLRSVNPYITSFKAAIELQTVNTDVQLIVDAKRRPTGEHARCFNLPTGSEVAVIMPGGHADKLDIILHSRQGSLKQISTMHPSGPMDITLISAQAPRKR